MIALLTRGGVESVGTQMKAYWTGDAAVWAPGLPRCPVRIGLVWLQRDVLHSHARSCHRSCCVAPGHAGSAACSGPLVLRPVFVPRTDMPICVG